MNKAIIALGIIGILLIPYIWLFFMLRKLFAKNTYTLETSAINNDISVIKDNITNIYLIKIDDGYIAIDIGQNIKVVKEELSSLNIKIEEIKYILLTHSDVDHVGAISAFPHAEVFLAKEEDKLARSRAFRRVSKYKIPVLNKVKHTYKLIEDKQLLQLSNRDVRCILTPGHTPGSMSYLIDSKWLFTGDLIALVDKKARSFLGFFTMNPEQNKQSIKKLADSMLEQAIEYVFTAHFGYSRDFTFTFKEWL